MLTFCNVRSIDLPYCDFWGWHLSVFRSSLWSRDSNCRNCVWISSKVDGVISWRISIADASASWCRPSWLCTLHWNVFLLGMAMYVIILAAALSFTEDRVAFYTVHAMQSKSITIFHNIAGQWQLFFFLDYAINNKLTPFISMQNHYNLIYREEEREMFPTLKVWLWPFFCGDNQ
jgi:hypothetical protein